jgi:GTPase KRas
MAHLSIFLSVDLAEGRQVSTNEGQQLAGALSMQYMETSVKNRYNVTESFVAVVKEIDRHHTETGGGAAPDPNAGAGTGTAKPTNRRRMCTLL